MTGVALKCSIWKHFLPGLEFEAVFFFNNKSEVLAELWNGGHQDTRGCFEKTSYLFIYLAALSLNCSIWDLSSLTRDRTWAPWFGSTESYLLDHQEVPRSLLKGWGSPSVSGPGS